VKDMDSKWQKEWRSSYAEYDWHDKFWDTTRKY